MIESPLCSSTAKRSSSLLSHSRLQSQNNNSDEQERPFPPPPPPSFFNDNPISSAEQRPTIRATGPGLTDGFVDDNCLYLLEFLTHNLELWKHFRSF
jgi:hypothetical protein